MRENMGVPTPFRSDQPHNEYTRDLLHLEQCVPSVAEVITSPLAMVNSPLRVEKWEAALLSHPDGAFVSYLIRGMTWGFRIGVDRHIQRCKPCRKNMMSANQYPQVVEEYLASELKAGRVVGPLDLQKYPQVQVSPFGVIPKSHQPNKWRLIVDLSSPEGKSVNDCIDKSLCSLSYVSVDDLAEIIRRVGHKALLAKLDIRSAYRIVPVHPEDRQFLGMQWKGKLFIDTALPFGLRSAPKLFNALADALEWIMRSRGLRHVAHYLDDFITVGSPDSEECAHNLHLALSTCEELGVPVAGHKCEGPSTCLTFLGIEVDTMAMELRLPQEKLQRLKLLVAEWRHRKSCLRKELESLVGHLSHACKVVRPGRRFLRGLIGRLAGAKRRHFHIRLNTEFRADLEWWHIFLASWNGTSLLRQDRLQSPDFSIWSDASGSWGCAAVWDSQWFQVAWQNCEEFSEASIAAKEMLPILVAAAVWGRQWVGSTVLCNSDNEAVVAVLQSGSAKDKKLAHMLRCLFFLEAKFQFTIVAAHIPGAINVRADALSRNHIDVFFASSLQARPTPQAVPQDLVWGLIHPQAWTSPEWTSWFSTI